MAYLGPNASERGGEPHHASAFAFIPKGLSPELRTFCISISLSCHGIWNVTEYGSICWPRGALEHETAVIGGATETEEESLDGVPPEERLKVLAGLPTRSEQSRANRRADVLESTFRHDRTAST